MRPQSSLPEGQSEQELLDGLPIPAAKLGRPAGGPVRIERANDQFRLASGHDERLRGTLAADVPLLSQGPIAMALRTFLDSDDPLRQFEADVGERHFVVRFSRLSGEDRCLLTLLDRTSEFGPERSFTAEPLRDRLSGLPNARAFDERVAELTEHPNFQPRSHAILTAGLAERNPTDELLVAVARRLLSALRAGDLLARTGRSEFRILMRLDRGEADALELADRLRATLSAPFRLTTCEFTTGCSVHHMLVA